MTTPSALVLRAAGTNCDAETAYAFERFGATSEVAHVKNISEDKAQVQVEEALESSLAKRSQAIKAAS